MMNNRYYYDYDTLRAGFEAAAGQVKKYRDKPADLMLFKPSPSSWSAQEVCQHLVEFGRQYLREMDSAISKTRPVPQRDGPYRPRWYFRKWASLFEPPYKLKLKTVPMFAPGSEETVSQTLDDLEDIQENIIYILDQAEPGNWNLQKIKGKNPVLKFLSMSLIEMFVLTEVHQRRHFWQIKKTFELFGEQE